MVSQKYYTVAVMWTMIICSTTEETDLKGPFDICEQNTFNATCPDGSIIMMHSAMYGRMSLGTCIQQHVSSRNCDTDVLDIMDGFCSGVHSCSLLAINPAFIKVKKCPEYSAYLQTSYRCLKVIAEKSCRRDTPITSASGNLASSTRQHSGAGTSYCPWTINADQRYNFTLYKFVPYKSSPLSSSSSVCFEIGTITEGGLSQGLLSCGTDPRTKSVYVSKGGSIQIHFKDSAFLRDLGNFVLQYNVVGCGEPEVPQHATYKREENVVKVTCDESDTSWQLTCRNGQWVGEAGQCIKASENGVFHWIKSNTAYSIGLLGIVTLACAAVIFCCGFCVFVTHFYITRQHRQQNQMDCNVDIYKLQTMQRMKQTPLATYERTTSLRQSQGTIRRQSQGTIGRNSDYQRMNPVDPETMSHHSYVLYDHVPKPLPPIPIEDKKHIYETPHLPNQ